MTALVDTTNGFEEGLRQVPPHASGWVNALRARGADAFARQGFPTTRQEEWRDTNVAPLVQTQFVPDRGGHRVAARELAAQYAFGKAAAAELVFVNGKLEPSLCSVDGLPAGVRVMSLAEAVEWCGGADLLTVREAARLRQTAQTAGLAGPVRGTRTASAR